MPTPEPERATSTPSGVIHDIGYRHYDGPRLGRGAVARSLFVDGLRGAYGIGRARRARIIPFVLLGLACLPALVWGLVVTIVGLDELPVGYTEFVLIVQVLVAMFVAAQAPVLASRDLRHRVVSLYFSRPIGRMQYMLARYASLTTAVFAFIATPLTLLFLCALLAKLPLSQELPDYLRAIAEAVMAAMLISGIALVVAAWTLRRGVGIAAIITVLLVASGLQGFIAVVAFEMGNQQLEDWSAVVSPIALVDSIAGHLLRAESGFVNEPSWGMGIGFAAVWLAYVLLCIGALAMRYRKVGVS
jgi:ABC-2 type transport system permease protein